MRVADHLLNNLPVMLSGNDAKNMANEIAAFCVPLAVLKAKMLAKYLAKGCEKIPKQHKSIAFFHSNAVRTRKLEIMQEALRDIEYFKLEPKENNAAADKRLLQLLLNFAERIALTYDVMNVPNVEARQYSASGQVYSLMTTAISKFFGEDGLQLLSERRQMHIERYKLFKKSQVDAAVRRRQGVHSW
ncbi:MAG: hypothetical protein SFW66_06220 [Gammaproteobacteria bacterium]|nr:hypothetical protein [Gammaproteobacteria bacterium]